MQYTSPVSPTMAIAQQSIPQQTGDAMLVMQRPINRLPVRKLSNDSKEAMNCKSCRKRKIKCNRLKPSCEACQVFNCPCVYDAIPKKRGPKTDVLEALLKRVNGLEKRLKDEQKSTSPEREPADSPSEARVSNTQEARLESLPQPKPSEVSHARPSSIPIEPAPEVTAFTDIVLDTYFARLHNKPFYILDESATRLRLRDGRLPLFLVDAINAVTIKYVPRLCGGSEGAKKASQTYMDRARAQIDVDEPTVENLQALLLLATANFQNGRGRKSQMVLNHAISMAIALSLHLELPAELRIAASEREGRRKLFWTCYLMDRFSASGSKRPSLIADESISLRLPAWQSPGSRMLVDGNYFPNGSSLSYTSGVSNAAQGSRTMLIEIVRVLGVTNRYLGAGGVKGDSHFPWHAQSTLSRIRSDLDSWAAATQDVFTSVDALFGSQDSSTLVLSKLIYHLIHCLIYRPFLPIDLSELSGTGQSQSWQIEATHLCFLHANAIGELCHIARQSTSLLDWPSFVGYCICTAGTIHIHGAHYMTYPQSDAYCQSADYLSRGMAHLLELRSVWAGLQHHRDTLTAVFSSHSELVKSLASNPMRFSPTFQMEDFFDRYSGSYIDGAHVTFSDVVILDDVQERVPAYNLFEHASDLWTGQSMHIGAHRSTIPSQPIMQDRVPHVFRKKRRATTSNLPYPTPKPDPSVQTSIEEEEAIIGDPPTSQPQLESAYGEQSRTFEGFSSGFSPAYNFSPSNSEPVPNTSHSARYETFPYDNGPELNTPSVGSAGSGPAETEDDPFLSLLGQLAENDMTFANGQEDMEFMINGHG